MARWRVVLRIPDGPEVPIILRGAQTVWASTGEGSAAEAVDDLRTAVDAARQVFDGHEDRERIQVDAGVVFGPRGQPLVQRIYAARTRAELDTLLPRILDAAEGR